MGFTARQPMWVISCRKIHYIHIYMQKNRGGEVLMVILQHSLFVAVVTITFKIAAMPLHLNDILT